MRSYHDHASGIFSYEMKITVEREMMESIRKAKTLQLAFTDTDWSLVVRTVRLGQERNVMAIILSHLQQEQGREVNKDLSKSNRRV